MVEDQIIACAKCGGKNRIPGSAIAAGAKARCGHCGAPLSATSIDDAAGIRAAIVEPAPKARGRAALWIALFLLIGGGGAAYFFLADRTGDTGADWLASSENSPPPEADMAALPDPALPEPAPAPLDPIFLPDLPDLTADDPLDLVPDPEPFVPENVLVPVPVAPGIVSNWTGAEPVAPFTVVTSPGRDYYVKLVYAGTSTEAVSIYVQGGTSPEFLIPLGSYEMRYASGTIWYGTFDLFGPDTAYAKAIGTFDFGNDGSRYTGYTVELILQEDGNLDTLGIGAEEF